MTREEAIQVLTDIKRIRSDEIAKAVDMAIEALQRPTDGDLAEVLEKFKSLPKEKQIEILKNLFKEEEKTNE